MSKTAKTCAFIIALAAAILAVAGSLGATSARAQAQPAEVVAESPSLLDEMAWALGFDDSKAAGFWEALQKARAEELEKVEAERVAANDAIIHDALTYGRRIDSVDGFIEIVPGPSGDVLGGDVYVRIGHIDFDLNTGVFRITTDYFPPGAVTPTATVTSEVRNDIETVTGVRGKTDVKIGDSRPLPGGGESAAGQKPWSIDPKKDGSMGRAAAGAPVEPALPGGTRQEFEAIKLPGGRQMIPWFEVNPKTPDLPFASGADITDPNWDGAKAIIAALSGKDGKAKALLGWVSDKGTDTLVAVHELEPGAGGGLEPGATRPTPKSGDPQAWTPAPSGSQGSGDATKEAGTGTSTAGDQPEPAPKDDPAPEDEPAPAPAPKDDTAAGGGDDWHLVAQHDASDKDGTTWHQDVYQKGDEDLFKEVNTTTKDGTATSETGCYSTAGKQDCPSGMTDEPTCHTDCERVAALAVLFCTGCDTGFNPLENAGNDPSKGPRPDWIPQGSFTGPVSIPYWAWSNPDHANAPKDNGDPADPNHNDPVQYVDPRFEGNVDPVEPELVVDVASESISTAMRGTLYDGVDPRTADETSAPPGSPPSPGDTEHHG